MFAYQENLQNNGTALILHETQMQECEGCISASQPSFPASFPTTNPQFKSLIDMSPEGIMVLNRDGAILYCNPAASTLLGRSFHDLEGLLLGISTLENEDVEIDIPRPDGTLRTAGLQITRFYLEMDELYLVTLRDITEKKRVHNALERSNQKYRGLMNILHEGILVLDHEGFLIFLNDQLASMLGLSDTHIIGEQILCFLQDQSRERLLDILKCPGEERVIKEDFDLIRGDGETIFTSWTINLIFDDNHQLYQIIASIIDNTAQKRIENSIREANRKLNLLSSITRHDVINHLTALNGYLEIAKNLENSHEFPQIIEKIETQASTIHKYIQYTQDYQDIGMYTPYWISIEGLMHKIMNQWKDKNINFQNHGSGLMVYADPLIEKSVHNLVDNAIRHGRGVTTITSSYHHSPSGITWVIEDNGAGVPEDIKEKIFYRGFGKHSGLGLFLVQEILSITGITIKETGSFGEGARFEMSIPKGRYQICQ